ncbi:DUF441 domain-containing protein [Halanaerobaculum tunisiense]
MQVNLALIIITILGLLIRNNSLIISGIILLVVRNLKLQGAMDLIDGYSVKIGIILIMLGVLAPLATGEMELNKLVNDLLDPLSLLAIVMGIAVTQFTREGISLLESDPAITVNLVVGVILGVSFFNGVPSGPLIASGITAVIYQFCSAIF